MAYIYYSYLNVKLVSGGTKTFTGYTSTSSYYLTGQASHYLKYYKGGRTYYVPLSSSGNTLHVMTSDGALAASSMSVRTAEEIWKTTLTAGGTSVFYVYYKSALSGSWLGTHTLTETTTSITAVDNWGATHTYTGTWTVSNTTAQYSIKTGYHSKYVYSRTYYHTFTRTTSSGNYDYLTYKISPSTTTTTYTSPSGKFYTSTDTGSKTTSAMACTDIIEWSVNTAKG